LKIYKVNRGIGQPLEFRGLKAQYLGQLVALSVGLLGLLGIMHVAGISPFVAVSLVFGLGGWGLRRLYRMSNRYGQHGLMKKRARRNMPDALLSGSRVLFIKLFSDGTGSEF
jgi:hypothetical protein